MGIENLFFIAGPQGAGKTTFLERLRDPAILFEDVELSRFKFDVEPKFRIKLKICQRAIENFCYYTIAQRNPDKIVIGNRCIYDQLVFDEVFVKRGWVNEEERKNLDEASKMFYHPELLEPNTIVLNPGYEVVHRHLSERWKKKGQKWNEGDAEYIHLACKGYETLSGLPNVYYIDHEIDLQNSQEFDKAKNWLSEKSGIATKKCYQYSGDLVESGVPFEP